MHSAVDDLYPINSLYYFNYWCNVYIGESHENYSDEEAKA